MDSFRFLTPTDVDRFIQIPETLQVDARSIVLTVEEDTLQKYDHIFQITDYVIYCEAPKDMFFNDASGNQEMDWKYKIVQRIDPVTNQYLGPHVEDAHGPVYGEVDSDIIKTSEAQTELAVNTTATRFVHYKQCHRFFKYSFKIGETVFLPAVTVTGEPMLDVDGVTQLTRKAQLYAVYLDKATGEPLAYWRTVAGTGNTQDPEVREYYYADNMGSILTSLNGGVPIRSELEGLPADVTIVAPPDPEFIEQVGTTRGGNLVLFTDASGLVIRQVGEPMNLTQYSADNFKLFSEDSYEQNGRALLLYWVVNPLEDRKFLGEELYAAWCSDANVRPIRDLVDASGNLRIPQPSVAEDVKEVERFTFNKPLQPLTAMNVRDSIQALSLPNAAPRMYLPVSKFIVIHDQPNEPDVHNNGENQFDVPFAYEVANATDFGLNAKKSIMGGRVMQMVSQYLFDDASNKEMAYFPFLLNESKALTDKIIEALANKIRESSTTVGKSRTEVLKQIMIKYGRRYFEEYAVLNELNNESVGRVWDVLQRLDEIFLFFSVTVRTTVSNRTKDDVEVIRMVEVPVVVRVYDPLPLGI